MRRRIDQAFWQIVVGISVFATSEAIARAPSRYICTFMTYASEKGLSALETPFTTEFIVDWDQQRAVLVGSNGIANVQLVQGSTATSFVETLETGIVQTTTIGRDLRAVHSRHTILSGSPDLPVWSQNYGKCTRQ